jgi:hypothetical protein
VEVCDMSDWFLLSSLDVIWTLFSFQCTMYGVQAETVHGTSHRLASSGTGKTRFFSHAIVALYSQISIVCCFTQDWDPAAFTIQGLLILKVTFITGVCEFLVFFEWGKSDFRRKIQQGLTTVVNKIFVHHCHLFSSDHSSERTKGQIRDKGRTDPRMSRVGDSYFL